MKRFLLAALFWFLSILALSAQDGEEAEEASVFPTWGHVGSYEDGLSFNFRIEKNRLRVFFIDAEGVLVEEPVVLRLNARIDPRSDDPELLPLNFDAATASYTHPKFIRRPFVMQVNLTMIGTDGRAIHSFQFFLSQQINSAEDLLPAAEE